MFCPRCGEPNDEDARYCASCGANIAAADRQAKPRSLRDRLRGIAGRSRRERLITAGTVAALLIALGAFIALDTPGGGGGGSGNLGGVAAADAQAADAACLAAKRRVARAAGSASPNGDRGDSPALRRYSAELLRALVEFRAVIRSLPASEGMLELDSALREASIEAGALARIARESPAEAERQALRLDQATEEVEGIVDRLDLADCARVQILADPVQ